MQERSSGFQWPAPWTPDILATLMFVVQEGKILLIRKKRGIGAGKVNGPGGKFEPGETALQCVLREVREELRINVTDAREMGVLHFSFTSRTIPEILCHVFMASSFTGTPSETPEAEPFWSPVEEIPYDLMWQDDRYWLPAMLGGKRFQAFFTFDGDRMLDYSLETEEE